MAKTKGAKKIQWNDVQADIRRMYVDEGLRLEDVRSRLMSKGFDASIRSYRSKINDWGFKKGSTSRTSPKKNSLRIASSGPIGFGGLPVISSCLSGGGPGFASNGHSHSSLYPIRLSSSTPQEPPLVGAAKHSQDTSTVGQQPAIPKHPRLPLDLEPTPTTSDNEFECDPSINTGGTPHPRTEIQTSTLQMFSGAVSRLHGSDEILLQAIDHIDRGRATELREILVDHSALVNTIIPSMAVFRQMSRYHDLPGKPLLYLAASTSTAKVVEVLLRAGADIDKPAQTFPRQTPLFAAVARSATPIVKLLLEKKATIATVDTEGHTALGLAVRHARDPQIVEMLLQSNTTSVQGRWSAYRDALFRRLREYGGPYHGISTRVVQMLTTTAEATDPTVSDFFLAPWRRCQGWASLINDDEKKSLMHLIGHGLDLHQSFAPPKVHSDATLAHSLLFHCWEADMPQFLAQNLCNLPNSESVGGLLLRTLAAGCPCGSSQGTRDADVISALLEYGIDPESEDQYGSCALSLWMRSLDQCSTQAEIENALPILAALLDRGGVNPNRACPVEMWPIADLLEHEWARRYRDTAFEVVVVLLAHFPDDMTTAPVWQLPRHDFPSYFPITGDFEKYGPDDVNLTKFRRFTQGSLSADSSDLLLRAAYIVSMRKYLALQFAADKDSRTYDKIAFVMTRLAESGLQVANIPKGFILDTINHVALLEQQALQPINSTETHYRSPLQAINDGNPSSEHPRDYYSTRTIRENDISPYGEGRCFAAGTNVPNDVLAADSRFYWNIPTYSHIPQPANKSLEVWPEAGLL